MESKGGESELMGGKSEANVRRDYHLLVGVFISGECMLRGKQKGGECAKTRSPD